VKHLVIDIETLGVEPDSAIISIGAVVMNSDGDTGRLLLCQSMFEESINVEDAKRYGKAYEDTVKWWDTQAAAVRAKVMGGTRTSLAVCTRLHAWITASIPDLVWANSPSFDLEMLKRTFRLHGLTIPWSFRQERCSRTLRSVCRDTMGLNLSAAYESLVPHSPLSDAYCDGRAILKCLQHLESKK
jgi:hypothetical protein